MKTILSISISILAILISAKHVYAIVNPLDTPNNKFGIHIIDESDLDDASRLVNGNGGSWGYVTIVIQENDLDSQKWQRIFDKMRQLNVIPVVRIATSPQGSVWRKPSEDDAKQWASFLDSLNWVVQNRYVVLFNEPNHAKEWGGEVVPEEYANITDVFLRELKGTSDDFFVLPAGIDLSAGNTKDTMNAISFYQQVYDFQPDFFRQFDGWTSHSYPNPDFSGSVFATGRSSIKGYIWEINLLKKFGLDEDIPIFITETGWVHNNGKTKNDRYYSAEEVAKFYKTAFTSVWTDENIVMISPFILNYQDSPFDHFSWKKLDGDGYNEQYSRVLGISKESGEPAQVDSAEIMLDKIPQTLSEETVVYLPVIVKNTGQKIWDIRPSLKLAFIDTSGQSYTRRRTIPRLEPNQTATMLIPLKIESPSDIIRLAFGIENKAGELISNPETKSIKIIKKYNIWDMLSKVLLSSAS